MHDTLGAAGMMDGWNLLWHLVLIWVVPMFALTIAATAWLESMISARRVRLRGPAPFFPATLDGFVAVGAAVTIPRHRFFRHAIPARAFAAMRLRVR